MPTQHQHQHHYVTRQSLGFPDPSAPRWKVVTTIGPFRFAENSIYFNSSRSHSTISCKAKTIHGIVGDDLIRFDPPEVDLVRSNYTTPVYFQVQVHASYPQGMSLPEVDCSTKHRTKGNIGGEDALDNTGGTYSEDDLTARRNKEEEEETSTRKNGDDETEWVLLTHLGPHSVEQAPIPGAIAIWACMVPEESKSWMKVTPDQVVFDNLNYTEAKEYFALRIRKEKYEQFYESSKQANVKQFTMPLPHCQLMYQGMTDYYDEDIRDPKDIFQDVDLCDDNDSCSCGSNRFGSSSTPPPQDWFDQEIVTPKSSSHTTPSTPSQPKNLGQTIKHTQDRLQEPDRWSQCLALLAFLFLGRLFYQHRNQSSRRATKQLKSSSSKKTRPNRVSKRKSKKQHHHHHHQQGQEQEQQNQDQERKSVELRRHSNTNDPDKTTHPASKGHRACYVAPSYQHHTESSKDSQQLNEDHEDNDASTKDERYQEIKEHSNVDSDSEGSTEDKEENKIKTMNIVIKQQHCLAMDDAAALQSCDAKSSSLDQDWETVTSSPKRQDTKGRTLSETNRQEKDTFEHSTPPTLKTTKDTTLLICEASPTISLSSPPPGITKISPKSPSPVLITTDHHCSQAQILLSLGDDKDEGPLQDEIPAKHGTNSLSSSSSGLLPPPGLATPSSSSNSTSLLPQFSRTELLQTELDDYSMDDSCTPLSRLFASSTTSTSLQEQQEHDSSSLSPLIQLPSVPLLSQKTERFESVLAGGCASNETTTDAATTPNQTWSNTPLWVPSMFSVPEATTTNTIPCTAALATNIRSAQTADDEIEDMLAECSMPRQAVLQPATEPTRSHAKYTFVMYIEGSDAGISLQSELSNLPLDSDTSIILDRDSNSIQILSRNSRLELFPIVHALHAVGVRVFLGPTNEQAPIQRLLTTPNGCSSITGTAIGPPPGLFE